MKVRSPFDVVSELPSLRRFARSLTRDASDAEDLVHDSLVRAYEGRHTFRPGANLRRWLLSVLHNTFVSTLRRKEAEAGRLRCIAETAEGMSQPDQESKVRLGEVMESFLNLPEDQRTVIYLIAIEGMSYTEAAAAVGVPVGTVMSRLGRARAALRAADEQTPRLRIVGGRHDRAD